MKRTNKGKKLVMKPVYRMRVEKDKTKYKRNEKHKGRKSDLFDICVFFLI